MTVFSLYKIRYIISNLITSNINQYEKLRLSKIPGPPPRPRSNPAAPSSSGEDRVVGARQPAISPAHLLTVAGVGNPGNRDPPRPPATLQGGRATAGEAAGLPGSISTTWKQEN